MSLKNENVRVIKLVKRGGKGMACREYRNCNILSGKAGCRERKVERTKKHVARAR